jgi:hypothetical protein
MNACKGSWWCWPTGLRKNLAMGLIGWLTGCSGNKKSLLPALFMEPFNKPIYFFVVTLDVLSFCYGFI